MNGMELIRELRSDKATRRIPVILLTAMEQEVKDKWQDDLASVNHIMSKPFSPRELLSRSMDLLGETSCR